MNLCDLKTVKQVMSRFGITFRKEFGQNFLTDRTVVETIADECCADKNSAILEIGPGIGTLTYELALRHKSVLALEIDHGLIPVLAHTLSEFDNVNVVNKDVMQADLGALLTPYFASGSVSVCANLPYYITSPILMKLLESGLPFDYVTIMIQKEVAERLCARAGDKSYGAITAVLNYYGEAEYLFDVPADRFVPAPKVDSAVVRIRLYKEKPCKPQSEALLFRTIKAAFAQRRKTLVNALDAGFPESDKARLSAIITACGFDADVRGEKLSIEDFTRLADEIHQYI